MWNRKRKQNGNTWANFSVPSHWAQARSNCVTSNNYLQQNTEMYFFTLLTITCKIKGVYYTVYSAWPTSLSIQILNLFYKTFNSFSLVSHSSYKHPCSFLLKMQYQGAPSIRNYQTFNSKKICKMCSIIYFISYLKWII